MQASTSIYKNPLVDHGQEFFYNKGLKGFEMSPKMKITKT